jgi:Kef-type K+ transport system membrane component KefB
VDDVIRRVKRRALVVAGVGILVGFAFGAGPGASLTICAAVVISSFLALEKLIERLTPGGERPGWRTLGPLLLVTVASFVLLGVVLWQWRGFQPVAGAAGLSVVVLAIIPELWVRR